MVKLIALLVVVSCATQAPPKKLVELDSNKTLWMGKKEERLALHPIFATMPVESRKTPAGIETRRYTEGGAITSKGECKGNQCDGVSNINACNHVFYLGNGAIVNYHRVGNCGIESIMHRPLDSEGNPEMTENEIKRYRAVSSVKEEEVACKKTAECNNGQSCKNGFCGSYGLWGKFFNP